MEENKKNIEKNNTIDDGNITEIATLDGNLDNIKECNAYNIATSHNFVKNISLTFVVLLLVILLAGLGIKGVNYKFESYKNELIQKGYEYYLENIDSEINIDESENNVIVKRVLKNNGNETVVLLRSGLNINKKICTNECNHDDSILCEVEFINLYYNNLKGENKIELKANESKTIEFEIPKEVFKSDKFVIKSYIEHCSIKQ